MRNLITGVAGFIGSTLADRLLADGHDVVGIDCFTDSYDPTLKRANVAAALGHPRFELVEADLLDADLVALLDGIDVVHHVAGQPGVRGAWGDGFPSYARHNVVATQRLLDACRDTAIARFVFSSSSSVYGGAEQSPSVETARPVPLSPYGVTKLAAEHLTHLYGATFGVPTVSLRYFTVYGPRQRPDMAISRLIEAARSGAPFPLNGDGSQTREFTFVDDVVEANVLAGSSSLARVAPGAVCNVGGGEVTSLAAVIAHIEDIVGRSIVLERRPPAVGEPDRTAADTSAAQALLGWSPKVGLRVGLERQVRALAR